MVYLEIGVLTMSFAIGAVSTYYITNAMVSSMSPAEDDTDSKPYPFAVFVGLDICVWMLGTCASFGLMYLFWNSINPKEGGYTASIIAFFNEAFGNKPSSFLYSAAMAITGISIAGLMIGERPGFIPNTMNTGFKFGTWSVQSEKIEDEDPPPKELKALQALNLLIFVIGTSLPVTVALSSG